MPSTQAGQVTIQANGDGRYNIIDNSWPADPHRKISSYESLRDAQRSLLDQGQLALFNAGTPFSTLSSVVVAP